MLKARPALQPEVSVAAVKVREILGSSTPPFATQTVDATALDQPSASRRMNAGSIPAHASMRTRQCHGAIPSRGARTSAGMGANASDRRPLQTHLPQNPAGNPAVQERRTMDSPTNCTGGTMKYGCMQNEHRQSALCLVFWKILSISPETMVARQVIS